MLIHTVLIPFMGIIPKVAQAEITPSGFSPTLARNPFEIDAKYIISCPGEGFCDSPSLVWRKTLTSNQNCVLETLRDK